MCACFLVVSRVEGVLDDAAGGAGGEADGETPSSRISRNAATSPIVAA